MFIKVGLHSVCKFSQNGINQWSKTSVSSSTPTNAIIYDAHTYLIIKKKKIT